MKKMMGYPGETEGPGPCDLCGKPAAAHVSYNSVENRSLELCPGTRAEANLRDMVEAVSRIVRETSKRVGGIRRDGTLPSHFADDIALALWETIGDDVYEYDEEVG